MKKFTKTDLIPWAGGQGLMVDRSELVIKMLDWQKRGLQETATGYGSKLTTSLMIHFEGKMRRIYCTCYSNAGSCWFRWGGDKVFIN